MLKKTVLRRKNDFEDVYKKGKSVGERFVVLMVRKNGLPYNRVAFLASKKVGKSVDRNRARRLMKESYREMNDRLEKGNDIVFIARKTIEGAKCPEVRRSMESAAKRMGLAEGKR